MWYFICIVIGSFLGLILGYLIFEHCPIQEKLEKVDGIENYLKQLIAALKQAEEREKHRPLNNQPNHNKLEAKEALKKLGFSVTEIDKIVNNLPNTLSTDDMLKIALQLLGKT